MEDVMIRLPESFKELEGEEIMSNCDGLINRDTEKGIKDKPLFSSYPGWNFCGKVWWQDNRWFCEVWQYKAWTETISADTLEDIMEKVSDEYGHS